MTSQSPAPVRRPQAISRRSLEASSAIRMNADRLFYDNGITETSMREVARAAEISLSRLTRMYPTKEELILEYLAGRHQKDVKMLKALTSGDRTPQQTLRGALESIVTELLSPGFRGCAFLNASAEAGHHYPSIRVEVYAHRDWYTDQTMALLFRAGHPRAADAADDLLLARDGGMASVHGGNVVAAVSAMRRAIQRALAAID